MFGIKSTQEKLDDAIIDFLQKSGQVNESRLAKEPKLHRELIFSCVDLLVLAESDEEHDEAWQKCATTLCAHYDDSIMRIVAEMRTDALKAQVEALKSLNSKRIREFVTVNRNNVGSPGLAHICGLIYPYVEAYEGQGLK